MAASNAAANTLTPCPMCGRENAAGATVCAACGHGEADRVPQHSRSLPRHTWIGLFFVYGLVAIGGSLDGAGLPDVAPFFTLASNLSMAFWAFADARHRGRPLVFPANFATIFVPWLAVPIYLILTRGRRGLGCVALHVIGLAFTFVSTSLVTWTLWTI